jgi:carboxylate-amine ligase
VAISWNPSRGPTLGIEWELQLIDGRSRMLRQDAREVLAALPALSKAGDNPKIRYELMQSTVEVVTGICSTVSEAKEDLTATIAQLERITGSRGVHVHVGIRDGSKAIPIVNALAAYLPHFLALTASSPFWSGHDTGLASSRAVIFGGLPTSGPPQPLADWSEFEEYMDTLLRAGTIRSIKEVWWDVRPHPDFGTVEIRMFDGVPTLREIGMVAAISQCLVQQFDTQLDRGYRLPAPSAWVVRDNKWRATRYGLDAIVITDDSGSTAPLRDELFELVRELEPVADRLGCAQELDVTSEVLNNGASYERQRALVANGGGLEDVVDALVTEFAEDRFVIPGEAAYGRT